MEIDLALSFRAIAAAALLGVLACSSARATTYSAVDDYNLSNPNAVWSYGTGIGTAQTPFTTSYNPCFGASNFECLSSGTSSLPVPGVGKVTSGASANFNTISVPNNVLWLHPGTSTDTSVVFTAPESGTYDVSGYFDRLDTTTNGNGVVASIIDGTNPVFTQAITNNAGTAKYSFNSGFTLTAGEELTFDINNDGSYEFDSTGLSATISSPSGGGGGGPEPSTWALMMVGVFGVGTALRRRKGEDAVALAV